MGEIQNLVLLALCWACTLSSSTLLTSIGPLTAEQVGAPESLAPLAVACFLFGAARELEPRTLNHRSAPHALRPCLAQVGALGLDLPPVRPARRLPNRVRPYRRLRRRGRGGPVARRAVAHLWRHAARGPRSGAVLTCSRMHMWPRYAVRRRPVRVRRTARAPYGHMSTQPQTEAREQRGAVDEPQLAEPQARRARAARGDDKGAPD